jgi:trypsin
MGRTMAALVQQVVLLCFLLLRTTLSSEETIEKVSTKDEMRQRLRRMASTSTSSGSGSPQAMTRIVDGLDASKDRYPYYVTLTDEDFIHRCGGSLIAPDVVLTAAHCGRGSALKYAFIGLYNPFSGTDDYEDIAILDQYPNPKFELDGAGRGYDQMLLQLASPSTRPLLQLNLDPLVPWTPFQNITVIGFGATDVHGTSPQPSVLQEVNMSYIPNGICEISGDTDFSYQGLISPEMICVLGDGQGQCSGDSGSPYILLGDSVETDIQVGIVSW